MTDQHPLTDESCDQITSPDHNDFRQALEETPTKFFYKYEDMRAAADWQLEQVVQAWEQCMEDPGTDIQVIRRFGQKLKAMRPTTPPLKASTQGRH